MTRSTLSRMARRWLKVSDPDAEIYRLADNIPTSEFDGLDYFDLHSPEARTAEAAHRAAAEAQKKVDAALKKNERRVSEQNLLLRNAEALSNARKNIPFTRITRVLTADPASLLNRMNLRPNAQEMFKIKPSQIAALMPKIRLHKLFLDEGGKNKMVELKFNDHTTAASLEAMTTDKGGRGDGVGIQSFVVETQGTNPAEGALVRCTLKILFQDLKSLASPSEPQTNYLDLILRRTRYVNKNAKGEIIPHSRIVNKKYFKLLATVGWAVPDGSMGPGISLETEKNLRTTLEKCNQTIFLSLYEHNIDFNQDGTAVLTAEYQGALEMMFSFDDYDILASGEDTDLVKRIQEKQQQIEDKQEKGEELKDAPGGDKATKALAEQVQALKKEKENLNAQQRAKKYSKILTELYLSNRIGTVDLSKEQMEAVRTGARGNFRSPVITQQNIDVRSDDAAARAQNAARLRDAGVKVDETVFGNTNIQKGYNDTRISFIYFGDLVEVAAKMVDENRKSNNLTTPDVRILLGPVTYHIARDTGVVEKKYANLADIPISLKSFEYWFNKNVAKNKINSYPLRSFLKSAMSELVLNALGENSAPQEGLRSRATAGLQTLMIPGQGQNGHVHRIPLGDFNLDTVNSSLFNGSNPSRTHYDGFKHYILLYGASERLQPRDPTNVKKDFEDGVYHFNIGSDTGLLRSLNFAKSDIPFLRESRLSTQDKEEGQLRDKYNANLELVGSSPLFSVGQKIYINPTLSGLGQITSKYSIARQLGLGGYYDVIKILSTIDQTGYRTNLECVWTSFGDEPGPSQPSLGTGGSGATGTKGVGTSINQPSWNPSSPPPDDGSTKAGRIPIASEPPGATSTKEKLMEEENQTLAASGSAVQAEREVERVEEFDEAFFAADEAEDTVLRGKVEITADNKQEHINTAMKIRENAVTKKLDAGQEDGTPFPPAVREAALQVVAQQKADLENGTLELQVYSNSKGELAYSANPAGTPALGSEFEEAEFLDSEGNVHTLELPDE